jgi:hypothetical protein
MSSIHSWELNPLTKQEFNIIAVSDFPSINESREEMAACLFY